MENDKLTEDEVILLLIDWLKSKDWVITDYCLGHTRGIDITAKKFRRNFSYGKSLSHLCKG